MEASRKDRLVRGLVEASQEDPPVVDRAADEAGTDGNTKLMKTFVEAVLKTSVSR